MQAYIDPPVDQNKCWFCKSSNLSEQSTCKCRAETTPTRKKGKKIEHRIYSFGSNCKHFPSYQRYHECLLDQAIQVVEDTILEDAVLVAVRVGSDSRYAIFIRDGNGDVRSCTNATDRNLQKEITKSAFLQVSRAILESHDDRAAGTKSIRLHMHSST
jgi:hypothetical protein